MDFNLRKDKKLRPSPRNGSLSIDSVNMAAKVLHDGKQHHKTEKAQQTQTQHSKDTPNNKVWLDENGKEKPLEEIKIQSAEWDRNQWNEYLADTVDGYQRESIHDDEEAPEKMSIEDYTASLVEVLNVTENKRLQNNIRRVLVVLNDRQLEFVRLRYWENMSLSAIAKQHGIRYQSVQKVLMTAHHRIKARMLQLQTQTKLKKELRK